MQNIKIIRYDEYRHRIQTHENGIYDYSAPMANIEILETLKRSIQELGILILMRDLETDPQKVIEQYNCTQEALNKFTHFANGWLPEETYEAAEYVSEITPRHSDKPYHWLENPNEKK